jgi:hydrogenase maturation protease
VTVKARAVLVGIGNSYRRDDGIGPAVAMAVSELRPAGVTVVVSDGEPAGLLEAWSGAHHAVLVDAVRGEPGVPGRLHRSVLVNALASGPSGRPLASGPAGTQGDDLAAASWTAPGSASTHRMGIADAVRLGAAVDQLPQHLVAFGVEISDIGFGPGLSPDVAAVVPAVVQAVLAELAGG